MVLLRFCLGLMLFTCVLWMVMGQSGRSDRECNDEGYSDICDCDYYKSVQCQKPGYGYKYGNGEGQSYKQKGQSWDEDCAACCCITVQDRTPAPTSGSTASPTKSPITVIEPTTPTKPETPSWSPVWTPSWHGPSGWGSPSPSGGGGGGGGGSGGGGHSLPKPKPKPKKPHPHKPKPKPKPHPHKPSGGGSGGGGGGGGGSSYNPSPSSWSVPSGWSAPSGWGAPSGCSSNDPDCWSVKEGSPIAPANSPTFSPTRGIPTKSDPQTSPPVPRPTPTKPTPYNYKYGNGEGTSYKYKDGYASMSSVSGGSRMGLWLGIAFLVTGLVGFAAGMVAVRRRRISLSEGVDGSGGRLDNIIELSNPEGSRTDYVMT